MALVDLLARDDLPADLTEAIREEIRSDSTEREADAQERLESFRLLTEAEELSGTGAWQWDLVTDTWRFSNGWLAILGCRDRHLSSDDLLPLAHPEDRERIAAAFERVRTGAGPYDIEHRIIRQDSGEVRVVHAHGRLIRDRNGEPWKVIGAAHDITERKRVEEELEQHRAHLEELVEERTKELRREITEREHAEAALRGSEEKFRIAQEVSPDGFTILRPVRDDQGSVVDFTWVYENDMIARLNGTDPKAVVGRRLLDLFPGHAGSRFLTAYQQVAETGEPCTFEDEYQGESIVNSTWFRIAVVPTGTDIAILAQDITERKRAEAELTASESKFRALFETLPQGVVYQDADGTVLSANPAAQDILGLTLDQMAGRTSKDPRWRAIHEDGSPFPGETHPAMVALQTGNRVENVVMGVFNPAQEDYRWIKVSAVPEFREEEDRPFRVSTTFDDFTERKRAESERQESETKYHAVVDALEEGVVFQLADGSIQACNASAERILGLTADQMMGRTSLDPRWKSIHEDGSPFPGKTHPMVHTLATGERTSNVIMGVHHPDGKLKWISISCNPLFHEGEDLPYGAVGSFADTTESRKLEEKLRRSQKMEAIGVLTGGIAHEFNNLLSPILGYSELLLDTKPEGDPERESLEQIQAAGHRAKQLVRQMLAYGRRSLSQRTPVRMETLVEEVIQLIRNTIPANIAIKKDIELRLPPVLGMSSELHQVILNLCLNASHAMPDGGELTLRLKKSNTRQFVGPDGREDEGNFIALIVQDTGVGMEQDVLDRVFDPFFTTKEVGQGSGLGLSVVQGIVEQHGGQVEIDSKVGEGSTFSVYLPIAVGEATPKVPKARPLSQGTERVLFIDDEVMITNLGKAMLERRGYTVTGFVDCAEALGVFADNPQGFDLVVTDYGMPNMNGKQLAQELRAIRPDIPIILCTGYGDLVAKEEIRSWGIDALLLKPFDAKKLSEVVRGVLRSESEE